MMPVKARTDSFTQKFSSVCAEGRQQTLSDKERSSEAVAEHKSILEAMKAGDSQLAEQLADKHICNAYRNMVKCGLRMIRINKDMEEQVWQRFK